MEEACESWRQFRSAEQAYVVLIEPSQNSRGETSQYTCHIAFHDLLLYYKDQTWPSCPAGYEVNGNNASGCQPIVQGRALGRCERGCGKENLEALGGPNAGPTAGNPVSLATGNKFEAVTDYRSGGTKALTFTRYYNSQSTRSGVMGPAWRHQFERRLVFVSSSRTDYYAADGRVFMFNKSGSIWAPPSDVVLQLHNVDEAWTLVDADDRVESFDSSGRLKSILEKNGYRQVLEYHSVNPLPTLVHDSHGRRLLFFYNADGLLRGVTDGDGRKYVYRYRKLYDYPNQPRTLLEEVVYPDGTPLGQDDNPRVQYLYEDPLFPVSLTGIIDEAGNRYATWGYDAEGRAITSEHAGATDNYSVAYNTDGSRTVTNPLGHQTLYHFTPIKGLPRVSQIDRLAGPDTAASTASLTYDTNGFLDSTTGWNGNVTNYSHNSRGLLTSRTEAVGEPEARTVTTIWHNDFRVPTQIVAPRRTIDFSYDSDGLLVSRTDTDTTTHTLPYPTNGQSRSWTYTYSEGGEGPGGTEPLPDVALALVNPGAEAGDMTGWTVTEGAFTVRSATPAPAGGTYYFYGGEEAPHSLMHQDVVIPAANTSEVDNGLRAVRIKWQHNTYQGRASGTVVVRFLDAADQEIGEPAEYLRSSATSWSPRSIAVDVPPLTRKIRLQLRAIRFDTIGNHNYFDEISLDLEARQLWRTPLTVQNAHAEAGDLSGWTSEDGSFQVRAADPSPEQGDYYFYPGIASESRLSQVVPIPSSHHDAVDAGDRVIDLTWHQYSADSDDRGAVLIAFLNGAGVQIGATSRSALISTTWWQGRQLIEVIPPDARSIRITLRGVRGNGSGIEAHFDYIFATLISIDVSQLPAPRQLVTIDGPRSDVSDTTVIAYDGLGDLETITDALGHVSSITARTASGLPLSLVDENGVETALAYDPRNRLIESRLKGEAGDAVTRYGYDERGLLTAITLPDGSSLTYEYDPAQRLTAIANELGERIEYTLDVMGNRTAEVVRSSTGTILRSQTWVFDALGRLLQQVGAGSQVTAYSYDGNGNQVSVTDPLSGLTAQAFDALDRLVQQTDPLSGITGYAYDSQDNLASVTDPRGLTTAYIYNGFGEVIQLESPDTGATVFTRDAAGNVLSQTDARGVVTEFTYDALSRPLTRSYPANPVEDVTYSYDDPALDNRGIGRLTAVTDDSGATGLVYDDYGNLVEESRTIDGVIYAMGYSYDVAGNLLQMTYPDGRIVTWQRDALGRVIAILTQADAGTAPVVVASNIVYEPFGPVSSLTFGNGIALGYNYDQNGRLTAITAGEGASQVQDLTFTYDDADNITAITDLLDAARSQTFQYDGLYRLTQGIGVYGTIDYDYDAVGNRTERTVTDSLGTLTETYTYDTASNRLLSLTDGATVQSFVYGASGQTVFDDRGAGGDLGFVYDGSDRLVQLEVGGVADTSYRHNAFGERVAKELIGSSETTHFHYNQAGQLIAESDHQGTFRRGYIYLDGLPIAQTEPSSGGTTQADETLDNEDLGVIVQGSWVSSTGLSGHEGADYLVHPGAEPVPAGGTVLDNSSPSFSTTGLWPLSSDLPGYEGADYQSRSHNGPFAETQVIDNLDAVVAGSWTASSNLSGYVGSNYLWHHPNGVSPETVVLDNADTSFTATGHWRLSSFAGGGAPYGENFIYVAPDADPTDTLIVDNSQSGFTTYGTWNTSTWTGGGGPFDGDVRWLYATHVSPDAILLDNTSAGFSVTGDPWNTSTHTGNGRLVGSNIFWLSNTAPPNTAVWTPTLPEAKEYRVYAWWSSASDRATNATYTVHHAGGYTDVTVNQRQGRDQWNLLGTFALAPSSGHRVELTNQANGVVMADAIQFFPVDGRPNTATWAPEIPSAQDYQVFARWTAESGRAQNATFTIHHSGGSSDVVVDQRYNGGQWNLLGTHSFAPESDHRVELTNFARGTTVADAVCFVPVNPNPSAPPPTATWRPDITATREYALFARWSAAANRALDATYVVHHAGGTSAVVVDQSILGGQWNALGTFTFAPGNDNRIELSRQASGYIVADAIQMVPTDGAPNSVIWPLHVPTNEYYEIETTWTDNHDRATDASYIVTHGSGSGAVAKNQQVDPGGWSSLGKYLISGDGSGSVQLTDQASGIVIADAVRLTADPAAVRTATWTYTASASGNYRVFARWPAGEGHATNAKYSVQHAGGSDTVTVSQAQRGGRWNELGVFAFAGGNEYAISLSDDANGIVVADAVYIVKVEEFTDAVTWAPAPPASGTYQVYAKWTSDETRATDALYRITHSGGTTEVSMNQRVGGGLWHYLGSYAFDPLTSPTVMLAANDNGSVAADAVRFVGGPGGAADIAYLHADHLGTPQAMTDATGQFLWWRDQTPFGQTVAEGGFSTSPLRFPGQYADAESGLAYNYFRDYDPALGRYIQSDPIGLVGGLNTYAYVGARPLSLMDPYGLAPGDKRFGLPDAFWQWYHRVCKKPGDPDLTREEAEDYYQQWDEEGRPGPDGKRRRSGRSKGFRGPPILLPGMEEYLMCTLQPSSPACQQAEVPQDLGSCDKCENSE